MRPINRGPWPTYRKGAATIRYLFTDYRNAKKHLVARTGDYCHLCEMRVNNALAVEHILPREHFPGLESEWENFLLICNSCNSHKRATIPMPYNRRRLHLSNNRFRRLYYLPHLHNTLLAFDVSISAIVRPKAGLTPLQRMKAQRTIALYGLDKIKTSTGDGDNRYIERGKALKNAIDRMLEYQRGVQPVNAIVDMAVISGFFSVWLKVFDGIPAVRTALIHTAAFHLASTGCFDVHEQLIPRNPGNLADPI